MKFFALLALAGLAAADSDCTACGTANKKWTITITGTAVTTSCEAACEPSDNPQKLVLCPTDCTTLPTITLEAGQLDAAGKYTATDKCLAVNKSCKSCYEVEAASGCKYYDNAKKEGGCLPAALKQSTHTEVAKDKCPADTGSASVVASFAAVATVAAAWLL